MSTAKSSTGIAHLGLVIAIVIVVAGVAFGGWYVWQKNKDDNVADSSGNTSQNDRNIDNSRESKDQQPTQKLFSLLDGSVSFVDDGTWKVATGGYWSAESGRCGRGNGPDQGCLDHRMLIPASEVFTNPDQFQVNISVFTDDRAPGTSLEQWIDFEVGPGGTNSKRSYPTLSGHKGYRSEAAYDENDIRLVYGVAATGKIVVIRSDFFKGDHNSFESSNDYRPLISKVDKLVESIVVE